MMQNIDSMDIYMTRHIIRNTPNIKWLIHDIDTRIGMIEKNPYKLIYLGDMELTLYTHQHVLIYYLGNWWDNQINQHRSTTRTQGTATRDYHRIHVSYYQVIHTTSTPITYHIDTCAHEWQRRTVHEHERIHRLSSKHAMRRRKRHT